MQKESFRTLSYEKKSCRYIAIYHGVYPGLTKMSFYSINAMKFQKFVYKRKDQTIMCICDQIIFQNEIYIETFIQITKICYFRSFSIKLQEKSVLSAKSEDEIVSRTRFHYRKC